MAEPVRVWTGGPGTGMYGNGTYWLGTQHSAKQVLFAIINIKEGFAVLTPESPQTIGQYRFSISGRDINVVNGSEITNRSTVVVYR